MPSCSDDIFILKQNTSSEWITSNILGPFVSCLLYCHCIAIILQLVSGVRAALVMQKDGEPDIGVGGWEQAQS